MAADKRAPAIQWDYEGKYLGFRIGPDKRHKSWTKVARKYEERLSDWTWSDMGLHPAIYTYNACVLPVLLFVAQLEPP